MTKEQFIENWLDQYERTHPDQKLNYADLREQADCAWYDAQIDAGAKTEYDLTPAQEKESKKARGSAKAVDAYGKSHKRERKPNEAKRQVIEILANALKSAGYEISVTNVEKQIDFQDFSVTLTQHRKQKE